MIINTIRTVIADLKQGLPTQITIIALYASVPLYECKCKHAIVNVWRPAENFGSQLSSPPWVLHIELKQSVLYNTCIPTY